MLMLPGLLYNDLCTVYRLIVEITEVDLGSYIKKRFSFDISGKREVKWTCENKEI